MGNDWKVAGVLGGMGPGATVDFMAKVIASTSSSKDQDHVRMLVDHNPAVPDRQFALLGDGEDPGRVIASMAAGLQTGGADFLVMPCNTAHAYVDAMLDAISIPFVSIIDLIVAACSDFESVGLLATAGCLRTRIYQEALAAKNINAVLSSEPELDELMRLIKLIKAGERGEAISSQMRRLAEAQVNKGAQAIIAACTEIPLVLDESMLDVPLVSSTDVLAAATVSFARGEVPLPGVDHTALRQTTLGQGTGEKDE